MSCTCLRSAHRSALFMSPLVALTTSHEIPSILTPKASWQQHTVNVAPVLWSLHLPLSHPLVIEGSLQGCSSEFSALAPFLIRPHFHQRGKTRPTPWHQKCRAAVPPTPGDGPRNMTAWLSATLPTCTRRYQSPVGASHTTVFIAGTGSNPVCECHETGGRD